MANLKWELKEQEALRLEILQIRDTGEVNMFDLPNVERLAYYYNCHRLVDLLHHDHAKYLNFIMTGNFY